MPFTYIKGQVLADLVAKFAECPEEMDVENRNMGEISVGVGSIQRPMPSELYVDGAANQRGSGVRLVLVSPEKITIEKSLRLSFSATNNEAEYEALLMGMAMVLKMGGKAVKIFSGDTRTSPTLDPRWLAAPSTYTSQGMGQWTKITPIDFSSMP